MRVITSERAWRGEESENAEILLRFGTHTLRAKMMKNFYSDQGKYQLDRWNGSEWKQVVSLPSQVGYELVGRVCGAPVPADFRAVLDLLMADAEIVLAAPQGGLTPVAPAPFVPDGKLTFSKVDGVWRWHRRRREG